MRSLLQVGNQCVRLIEFRIVPRTLLPRNSFLFMDSTDTSRPCQSTYCKSFRMFRWPRSEQLCPGTWMHSGLSCYESTIGRVISSITSPSAHHFYLDSSHRLQPSLGCWIHFTEAVIPKDIDYHETYRRASCSGTHKRRTSLCTQRWTSYWTMRQCRWYLWLVNFIS